MPAGPRPEPIRVAVVGGGCAAMTAAFELTRPELEGRYAVTVYQMGWRLGGKGASGRGSCGRIEEHGLHLWMGYYENAFRLIRACYAELQRDRGTCPIADWTDAFSPANANAVADWSPSGRWLPWLIHFPPAPGLPGDPDPPRWSVADYLTRAARLVVTLLASLRAEREGRDRQPFPELTAAASTPERVLSGLGRLVEFGALVGLGGAIEGVRLLEAASKQFSAYPQNLILALLDRVTAALQDEHESWVQKSDSARRLWEVIDLLLATLRGAIRFRLVLDPRGFDALDEYDSRQWLRMNGASEASIDSAFLRGLYDLAFAYEGGDPQRPRIAAGAALRGAMRAFFTYRGAFFWKMRAGMGDVIFAPLYEVLQRRGVRFEFFRKLRSLEVAPDGAASPHIEALRFDVQARVAASTYQPLVDVKGVPCWPAQPDWSQLVDGERIEREGWDLESQWDTRCVDQLTLRVGTDFDLVILGVGLGVIPHVCGDLLARDRRWRELVEHVKSVPTQAFQLWLKRGMPELGWARGAVNLSGFVEPFDTWADMTHVGALENWPESPKAVAYFCNALPDDLPPQLHAGATKPRCAAQLEDLASDYVRQQTDRVRSHAIRFLDRDIAHLWPEACGAGGFRWDALLGETCNTSASFDGQFWTANVRPSDRYTQALPGTTRYRISPLDAHYDNFTIAGDWTDCSLNMGCVEAAVMSGMLAAHAIARFPRLSDIVGFDHP